VYLLSTQLHGPGMIVFVSFYTITFSMSMSVSSAAYVAVCGMSSYYTFRRMPEPCAKRTMHTVLYQFYVQILRFDIE